MEEERQTTIRNDAGKGTAMIVGIILGVTVLALVIVIIVVLVNQSSSNGSPPAPPMVQIDSTNDTMAYNIKQNTLPAIYTAVIQHATYYSGDDLATAVETALNDAYKTGFREWKVTWNSNRNELRFSNVNAFETHNWYFYRPAAVANNAYATLSFGTENITPFVPYLGGGTANVTYTTAPIKSNVATSNSNI